MTSRGGRSKSRNMRRPYVAAFLRLLFITGSAIYVACLKEEEFDISHVWIDAPSSLVALAGDVHMHVRGVVNNHPLHVRLAREENDGRALIATMPLTLDSQSRITIPCGYFARGGIHYIEIVSEQDYIAESLSGTSITNKKKRDVMVVETADSMVKTWKFDVLWPSAKLEVTPEQVQTYPERQVTAILEFPKVMCSPIPSNSTPDIWLELLFCGTASNGGAILCNGKNTSSRAHVLYSQQVQGFNGRNFMTLRCELFGQAGDYALILRPSAGAITEDLANTYVRVDWSEQFVLNVHGGSIFPCGDGVRVLFQYPECVLEGSDRIRVFGRDADKMRYIAERRVRRGQHTASFDCRLFSERYAEYCFVYVSQSITGAVADVRMDCLPTLPLLEGGAGEWGLWSSWSSCPAPARCSTRTRSRHRFCDSPPPAYGAKYCEGQAVELAACECHAAPWAGDSSVVVAEIGAQCRCGCVLHLAPVARLLAGSAKACAARSFWLLQAEVGMEVRLRFESVRLPCLGQALRARDGDSLGSPLLATWDGPDNSLMIRPDVETTPSDILLEVSSSGRYILVEMRSTDTTDKCAGGFLAHAAQIKPKRNVSDAWASATNDHSWWSSGVGARVAAVTLAAMATIAALALAAHSAHRTRTYQRAADRESLTDSDAGSESLELGEINNGSRSTLLSDVTGGVSLSRLLGGRRQHTRLRDEDAISENAVHGDDGRASEGDVVDNESEVSAVSGASKMTATPENGSSSSAPAGTVSISINPAPLRRSRTVSSHVPQMKSNVQPSTSEVTSADMSICVMTMNERDSCSEKDKDSIWEKDRSESRASSSVSAATLTNGWYSPALSGVSSARIRDNPKYTKENCNRKLLRSDLSLTSHPEMEIDYYDYEVKNAGTVPGSYLGMDPAFLVWIPPIEEGDIIREIDEHVPIHEKLPSELRPDTGSNTESPEENPAPSLTTNPDNRNRSNDSIKSVRKVIDRGNIIHPLNFSISDLQTSSNISKKGKKKKDDNSVFIPMHDLNLTMSPVKVHKRDGHDDSSTLKRITDTREKDETLKRTTDFNDIKFADENSDSSSEIKFGGDSPGSNRVIDKYDAIA